MIRMIPDSSEQWSRSVGFAALERLLARKRARERNRGAVSFALLLEVPARIAPAHGGFADPCLTTWLRHQCRGEARKRSRTGSKERSRGVAHKRSRAAQTIPGRGATAKARSRRSPEAKPDHSSVAASAAGAWSVAFTRIAVWPKPRDLVLSWEPAAARGVAKDQLTGARNATPWPVPSRTLLVGKYSWRAISGGAACHRHPATPRLPAVRCSVPGTRAPSIQ
jgi:hypothetical protein